MLNQNIDLSLRQVEIKNKMVEAKKCHQFKVLDHLCTKWVHRFGLESLPIEIDDAQNLHFNQKDNTLSSINDLTDVYTLRNRTCIDEAIVKEPMKSFELTNDSDIKEKTKEFATTNKSLEDNVDKPLTSYISPPPRILNRFRKWLPTEMPKAS